MAIIEYWFPLQIQILLSIGRRMVFCHEDFLVSKYIYWLTSDVCRYKNPYLNGCSTDVFCTAFTMVIPIRYKNATTSSDKPTLDITLITEQHVNEIKIISADTDTKPVFFKSRQYIRSMAKNQQKHEYPV